MKAPAAMLLGLALPLVANRDPAARPWAAREAHSDAGPQDDGVLEQGDAAAQPQPALVWEPRYHDLDEASALLDAWSARAGARIERGELAISAGGRPVPTLAFGASGPLSLDERPAVFLVGGLDGRSLAGAEAVLAVTDALLARASELRADLAFVAIPWAAPDGLARSLEIGAGSGANDRPRDDDGDGRTDEDGPDDVDGDGELLEMLVEDARGPWVLARDRRFLVPAADAPGAGPRYLRLREGRDDDGDGRFNEDPPGGVVLDRQFPIGWRGPLDGPRTGDLPLEEPVARALAEAWMQRPAIAVLLFQGEHGGIVLPGSGSERPALAAALARHAGRARVEPLGLAELPLEGRGSALAWLHAATGALAMEVAPWGPGVPGGPPCEVAFAGEAAAGGPPIAAADRPWLRWLDDARGGIGFVPWHQVDLGGGALGLVGGWRPRTRANPPPELLGAALAGLPRFVRWLAEALPRPECRLREVSRRGPLIELEARVRNAGELSSACGGEGRVARSLARWELALELPEGARLAAGAALSALPALAGGAESAPQRYWVELPRGSAATLVLRAGWGAELRSEVRP